MKHKTLLNLLNKHQAISLSDTKGALGSTWKNYKVRDTWRVSYLEDDNIDTIIIDSITALASKNQLDIHNSRVVASKLSTIANTLNSSPKY